jgi:methionyl-tRNA formyltransferase
MRVIFMGTPDFAVPTLQALVDAGHEVVLVVAQPDRRAGRGKKMRSPPVAERAKALGLPLSQPRAIKSGSFPARVLALEADVAVVVAYGRILTETLLKAPRFGSVNVHASLLPRWRGAAPIQASLLHGDEVTGVCTQRMEEGLDTGPIYCERSLTPGAHETTGELHDRLSAMSAEIAVETLEGLEARVPTPQDESAATWAPKISKQDGCVDWRLSATALDRRIRAMSPWPGGWAPLAEGQLKIREARPVDASGSPGQVLSVKPLVVACGEGALELMTVQAAGRRPVSGTDYANGVRMTPGEQLPWPS